VAIIGEKRNVCMDLVANTERKKKERKKQLGDLGADVGTI
jgi:hypothetical protein